MTQCLATDDSLYAFLSKHKSIKPVDTYYKMLNENCIDYDALITSDPTTLKEALEEIGMKKLQILHLTNALKKTESSQIYKQSQRKLVIVLSNDEENARNDVQKNINKTTKIINNINQNINKLNKNTKQNQDVIINKFDEIIKMVNKRKNSLLNELNNISNNKKNKLMKQLNDYKIFQNKLNKCYDQTNNLISDLSIHSEKRKTKILANTKNVLTQNVLNVDDFILCTSVVDHIDIDVSNINDVLLTTGNIHNDDMKTNGIVFDVTTSTCTVSNITQHGKKTFHPINANINLNNNASVNAAYSKGYNSGIHEFKLKVKNTDWCGIGITSNIENCKTSNWIYLYKLGYTYYLRNAAAYYSYNTNQSGSIKFSCANWKTGDIIKIVLDCNQWKLQYYTNNNFVGEFNDINQNLKYYFVYRQTKKQNNLI